MKNSTLFPVKQLSVNTSFMYRRNFMKKRKWLAFIFALTLLAPTLALTACKENEEPVLPDDAPPIEAPPLDNEQDEEEEENGSVALPLPKTAQYIRCTGDSVNLRKGAGASYSVVGRAKKGEIYAVIEKQDGWYKTYYRNQTVYISASYTALLSLEENVDERVEAVIDEGYKLLGVPYVYGAVRLHDGKGNMLSNFSVQKFDCSSLVQYVFYKGAGKILQVTTRTQVKQGQFVAKKDIQRGDCLFFTNESRQYLSGIERVGHVAIYLGDDYILHTSSDYARIEKMTASRWKFYIETRRFI
ncbi:MAG: NlpC/P60 family protein [Clostridiales bacterium]|nr:NlpC/P60 family protein [Clostridiales bacterium]